MKILLIADQEDWILGKIARQYFHRLAGAIDVTVLIANATGFMDRFERLQPQHDAIHFLSPWDFYLLADRLYKPIVLTLWHMVDWKHFDNLISRVDTLCVGSNQWLERAKRRVSADLPMFRLPYGVDVTKFRRQDNASFGFLEKSASNSNGLLLGFAGSASSNQSDRKGLDRLWSSLKLLKEECNRAFVLRMIGKGWNIHDIPESLRKSVQIEGFIPDVLLADYYSSLDYYLCLSRIEGVPYPVVEAMSCGTIVLSTPVGIVPEIILNRKNGFILSESAVEADLVRIIRETMDESDKKNSLGMAARKTIVERLSWEAVFSVDDIKKMYSAAIDHCQARTAFQRITNNLSSKVLRLAGYMARKKAALTDR